MFGYISFKARIMFGFLAVISLMTGIVAIGLVNFSQTQRDVAKVDDTFLPNALLAERMAVYTVQVQQLLTQASISRDPDSFQDAERAAEDFKHGIAQFRERLAGEDAAKITTELAAIKNGRVATLDNVASSVVKMTELTALETGFDWYYSEGKRMTTVYAAEGVEAGNLVMKDFNKLAKNLRTQLNRIKNQGVNDAKNNAHAITESTKRASMIMLSISSIGISLGLGIAVYLTRYLDKRLGIDPFFAKGIAMEIAEGNLTRSIQVNENDTSSLLYGMKHMQQQLLERITAERKAADETLRVKIALDNVSTGVMIADNDRNIIYANQEVINILDKAEMEIGRQLSIRSINNLIGANMDDFHENPSHQAKMLTSLTGSYEAAMMVGSRSMIVIASPVINEQGQRLGTVAEWHDRTDEVMAENEVAIIVEAAAGGDFSMRFDLEGKEGFLRHLGVDINQLMQISETSLNEVVRVLNALSRGDLTETISNDYSGIFGQLKDDSNTTVEKLKAIISQIKDAIDGINIGTKEIASGNNDLSHRTEQQAASLEQTAASMEELTSAVQHNAKNAQQANQLAVDASNIAGRGVEVVGQVVMTMDDINKSSRKIGDIISVIDDIAFQTNILALNAAVEAARAGEQGRGFAVVAVEVRNLAQRAATAAGEIKDLISDSVDKVSDGSKLVTQAGLTMEEIVASIRGVTDMMAEITAASSEQSSGIEQVNQAIAQMDDVTQQNAALVEQAAAAAESLEEQVQNLVVTVSSFKVDDSSVSTCHSVPGSTIPTSKYNKSPLLTTEAGNWKEF
ncbi:MAG: methyl-accepting chemotaxis protein [Methylobacter sp.]|uniref:methyl-accepting chemotaxis protein n=1 Tax=Methylobacter sp. TaxID=2051955 RepID=UPI0027319314|nr:methyl-accepting chemotaxis protein [Methylobacter sp.]MDP1663825.1 methyl-accepting chemotaxis protein [Methylobacter sp.]